MANIVEKAEDYMSSASISRDILRDRLSEFLAVERGGLELYERALQIVKNPNLTGKLRDFRDQTRKHEAILMRLMDGLGMDSTYLSPTAKIAQQKATALLNTMVDSNGAGSLTQELSECNALENLVLAETKDHSDWELLGKIARQSQDEQLRNLLKPAVDEVEPEEDDHVTWAKTEMAKLAFKTAENK